MLLVTKKITILFALSVLSLSGLYSQENSTYSTGIGLRGGLEGGLTLKHFISSNRALEGILSTGWGYGGFRVTGLYEIHKPLTGVEGLTWFYGIGAHMGMYSGSYYGYYGSVGGGYYDKHGNWHPTGYSRRYTTIGIDVILGLEYKFAELPVTCGIDIKPYVDITGSSGRFSDGAFSIRYTFN